MLTLKKTLNNKNEVFFLRLKKNFRSKLFWDFVRGLKSFTTGFNEIGLEFKLVLHLAFT